MNTWFISDTHFGHSNIIKHCYRPFSCIKEMDFSIIENWNKLIKPKDIVWHLGDFSFRNVRDIQFYTKKLNGCINLILGNHDNLKKKDYHLFHNVYNGLKEISIKDEKIVLCHYPLLSWNAAFYGRKHLFGHVHSSQYKKFNYQKNSYDVGVDNNNFQPVSYDEIIEKMNKEQNSINIQEIYNKHGYKGLCSVLNDSEINLSVFEIRKILSLLIENLTTCKIDQKQIDSYIKLALEKSPQEYENIVNKRK